MLGLSLDVLVAPLAVQEMVMAAWLITKGFNPSAFAAGPAADAWRWRAAAPGNASAA